MNGSCPLVTLNPKPSTLSLYVMGRGVKSISSGDVMIIGCVVVIKGLGLRVQGLGF